MTRKSRFQQRYAAELNRIEAQEKALRATKKKRRRAAQERDEEADNLDWTPEAAARACRVAANIVSGACDVAPENLYRATRGSALESEQRQIVMWLLRKAARMSLPAIAAAMARDRSTVAHGVEVIEAFRTGLDAQGRRTAPEDPRREEWFAEIAELFTRLDAIGRETVHALKERAAAAA